MNKEFKIVVFLFAAVFVVTLQGLRIRLAKGSVMIDSTAKRYTDVTTRKIVKDFHVSDIESIHLYGLSMGCFGGDGTSVITVSDTKIIGSFLTALRQATTDSKIRTGNGIDTLEIHFKRVNGRHHEDQRFSFNPQMTNLWYGPGFKAALDELAMFQAKQTRRKVSNITIGQLRSVSLGRVSTNDHYKMQLLLKALKNVDSQAYAYTIVKKEVRPVSLETMRVVLKSGKTIILRFFPSPYVPNAVLKPLWDFYDRAS